MSNKSIVILFFILITTVRCEDSTHSNTSPNVILIMCDDLGWGDVGFNGHEVIQTPYLDKLAASGLILNRFYSGSAVCSPTRASCLTGRNPNRIGILTANSGHMLQEEITLPELLKEKGYQTGHFGKWHLGTLTTMIKDANRGKPGDSTHYSLPIHHGYDEYLCTESKVPTWDPLYVTTTFDTLKGESRRYGWAPIENDHDSREYKDYGTHYWTGVETEPTDNLDGSNARVIMDRATKFITKSISENKNFFSTIWFHTPHLPLVVGKKYRDLYPNSNHQEQLHYGAITAMDEQVGRLVKLLESLDVKENTMIWFCSDNGPENGTPGMSGPFRERKRSLYEGGVRVPGILSWPSTIKPDQHSDVPLVTSDYILTILDLLNIQYPDQNRPMDGISAKNILLNGEKYRNKPIGFKLHQKISWVTDTYKLISTNNGDQYELYNLIDDPAEKNNIASLQQQDSLNLHEQLNQWLSSVESSKAGQDY